MTNKKCKVLGYDVDLLSFDEALNFAVEKMQHDSFLHIITINPEIIALADKDKTLSDIIKNSELVLPESSGIKTALKFKGINQEQIAGIDYSKKLIQKCAELDFPIALIGAKEHVIQKTISNLKSEFPNLNIAYAHNGYFDNDTEIIQNIKDNKPKFVLCALGAPKQEKFINKCKAEYSNAVYIGIGGSFDVWAGEVERAPQIFQKAGLEWLYRTVKQPSRIKRIYKTLPMFLFRAIIDSMKNK